MFFKIGVLKHFVSFTGKGSRTIAPEENCPPPNPKTNPNPNPNPNLNRGAIFLGGNCPDTTGKELCGSLFLIKLQAWHKKESPTQVFSCDICEIFTQKPFFTEHLGWQLLFFLKQRSKNEKICSHKYIFINNNY